MVGTGGDRTIGCEGAGGSGSRQRRVEGRRRDRLVGEGAVVDDGFGIEDRGYNIAH